MRILVAGASGVLGRPSVRALREAGHDVVGLARSSEARDIVRSLGAEAAPGDLFDRSAVVEAARGADAVVNLTGALPTASGGRKPDWDTLGRVWREGTRTLLDVARDVGADIFIQASLGLLYGDHGEDWVTEQTPLADRPLIAAAREADDLVAAAGAAGLPTVTLRLGMLYGRDAWHTRLLVAQARKGALAVVGDGAAYWSLIHIDDAAQAIARAVEDAEAGTVYNVCDDRPTRMADLFATIARLADAPAPSRVPAMVARMLVGGDVVSLLTTSVRMSNRAIRQDLELTPRVPSAEEGLRQIMSGPVPDPD